MQGHGGLDTLAGRRSLDFLPDGPGLHQLKVTTLALRKDLLKACLREEQEGMAK